MFWNLQIMYRLKNNFKRREGNKHNGFIFIYQTDYSYEGKEKGGGGVEPVSLKSYFPLTLYKLYSFSLTIVYIISLNYTYTPWGLQNLQKIKLNKYIYNVIAFGVIKN